jgi:anti-sigma factor RsiW
VSDSNHRAERSAAPDRDQLRVGVAERSHDWIEEQLGDYLEGSLGADDAEHVREHLRGCRRCDVLRRTYARTVRLVESLPERKAPSSVKRRILDSLP